MYDLLPLLWFRSGAFSTYVRHVSPCFAWGCFVVCCRCFAQSGASILRCHARHLQPEPPSAQHAGSEAVNSSILLLGTRAASSVFPSTTANARWCFTSFQCTERYTALTSIRPVSMLPPALQAQGQRIAARPGAARQRVKQLETDKTLPAYPGSNVCRMNNEGVTHTCAACVCARFCFMLSTPGSFCNVDATVV